MGSSPARLSKLTPSMAGAVRHFATNKRTLKYNGSISQDRAMGVAEPVHQRSSPPKIGPSFYIWLLVHDGAARGLHGKACKEGGGYSRSATPLEILLSHLGSPAFV